MQMNRWISVVGGYFFTVLMLVFVFFSSISLRIDTKGYHQLGSYFNADIKSHWSQILVVGLCFLLIWVGVILAIAFMVHKVKIARTILIFGIGLFLGWLYNNIVWSVPLSINDSGYYHTIAQKLANNIPLTHDRSTALTSLYPHVAFISWILSKVYSLGNSTSYLVAQMFNTFCGSITAVLIYQLVLLVTNNKSVKLAIAASITFLLWPARLILESAANTESISQLLNILAFYLLFRLFKQSEMFKIPIKYNSIHIILSGMILAISYCIRADNIVFVIALVLSVLVYPLKKKNIKRMAYFLVVFLAIFYLSSSSIRWGIKHAYNIPIAKKSINYVLATGLYFDENNVRSSGHFNSEGWEKELEAYDQYTHTDINQVNDVAMNELYKERRRYINEHKLWDELFYNKSIGYFYQDGYVLKTFYDVTTVAKGTTGIDTTTSKFKRTHQFFEGINPIWARGTVYLIQILHTLLLITVAVMACFFSIRKSWHLFDFLLSLSFIGSWMLYTFLAEVQGRYSYFFFITLIVALFTMISRIENFQIKPK